MVKKLKVLSCKVIVIISFALLRSSAFNFLFSFQTNLFLTNFTQLPFLNRHEKVTPFMEISVNGKEYFKILSYKFSVFTSFALLESSFFNFLHSIQIILFLTILTQMPSLNWYRKVTIFMEFSVNGKKQLKKNILQVFRHYFKCKAAVKLLQFLTFISDHSVFNKIYSNAFFKSTRE